MRQVFLARSSSDTLQFAEKHGLLKAVGVATEIGCEACGESHVCRIVRSTDGQHYYRCAIDGVVKVSTNELRLLAFNRECFLSLVARAAKVPTRCITTFANDYLVGIGLVPSIARQREWYLGYADGLWDENVLAGVVEALSSVFPKGPGLIATVSVVPFSLPLPKGYRFISLQELLMESTTGFALNIGAASVRLGRHKRDPKQRGRPTSRCITEKLAGELSLRPDWPEARTDQARLIHDRWPKQEGRPPALGTIANQLRRLRESSR